MRYGFFRAKPVGLDGFREWNNSLCSCYETPGLTAGACLCPCLVYSSNRSRLTHLSSTGQRECTAALSSIS